MKPLSASLGDPAGVGPELLCEAWAQRETLGLPPFFVAGGASILAAAAWQRGLDLTVGSIASPGEAADAFADVLPVLGELDGEYAPGEPDSDGATLAFASLEAATKLTIEGEASALVTSPVSKALLAAVGFRFPGQTEFLAHACGIAEHEAVMMLAGPHLRTVPVTVHVPLCRVSELLNVDELVAKSRIVAQALQRDFAIA
ncbi:MAG TPA: 4-hydroxythreonine-4-phosphate dehydrogenase PdxA, partial [Sphingomonadaceae bacterium]|nr:4-hydroxythreonine-4-phosphate dehydrogenase PdxA [Sphingomonadaceae bacterium]